MRKSYIVGVLSIVFCLLLVGCLGGGGKDYAVSGRVLDESGTGIKGVELALEGMNISFVAETKEDGSWTARGLRGTVKVSPSKDGWTFDPVSKEVTKENKAIDFTGAKRVVPVVEYSVAGMVADGLGIGIEGVKLILEGTDISLVAETAENGSWTAEGLLGTVRVRPIKDGWFFNPMIHEVVGVDVEVDFTGVKGEDLVVLMDGGGTVRQEILMSPLSVDYYPRTTEVQLTAEPDFDWFFDGWLGDIPEGMEKENPIVIDMDGPKTITAVFMEKSIANVTYDMIHDFPQAWEQAMEDITASAIAGRDSLRTQAEMVPREKAFDTDERIIMMDSSLSRVEQVRRLESLGYVVLDTVEVLNAHLVQRVEPSDVELMDMSGVLSVDYNYAVHLSDLKVPNDRFYSSHQWWHYDQIRLPQAWAVTTGDKNIRVAVIDTGISTEHPDLIPSVNLELGASFVPGQDFTDIEDEHGHGSHVSGTIGAVTNNELGMAGIMWDVEIIPIKVFDASGRANNWEIVQGILYAAGLLDDQEDKPSIGRPADVVNMSLGGPFTEYEQYAVQEAYARDVIIVAATGNDGYPIVDYPAAHPEVIAVGATGVGETLTGEPLMAYYSNHGTEDFLMAPGGGVVEGSPFGYVWSTGDFGSYYGSAGTSMASPHVAGVVGLMLANGIPKSEVRGILERTAMKIHDNDSYYYGQGLVNAFWAVNAVENVRLIQGLIDGSEITAINETVLTLGDVQQTLLNLDAGEYELIAWVDVNGNDLLDTGDYLSNTGLIDFGYGEGWTWRPALMEYYSPEQAEASSIDCSRWITVAEQD